jgi:hypothetical protein
MYAINCAYYYGFLFFIYFKVFRQLLSVVVGCHRRQTPVAGCVENERSIQSMVILCANLKIKEKEISKIKTTQNPVLSVLSYFKSYYLYVL